MTPPNAPIVIDPVHEPADGDVFDLVPGEALYNKAGEAVALVTAVHATAGGVSTRRARAALSRP
ncbi:MAG: hypothetical protein IH939_13265 [Acidobacteria bacterium]|nr:hypothetical protein [Acidobacteriota bacterium]